VHAHLPAVAAPNVDVHVPQGPAPVVNVREADVNVHVPVASAPTVNVQPADVTVNVPPQAAPHVDVHLPEAKPKTIKRDADGNIVGLE
jgi:hypothetical protein